MAESLPKLGLIFGGPSAEHEVSLRSASGVLAAIDRQQLQPVLLGVDREGRFYRGSTGQSPGDVIADGQPLPDFVDALRECDVLFPLSHGPFGEDGTLQALMEYAGVPYVGSGIFTSSLCMDKGHFKRWMHNAGLPVGPYASLTVRGSLDEALNEHGAELSKLRYPLFVKPANLGSSVGIGRAAAPEELRPLLEQALRYDSRIVVEQGLDARELEVAVLDTGATPKLVSDVGEIELPAGEWYDYENKYSRNVARLHVPAELEDAVRERARSMALTAFEHVGARDLARVDFFLEKSSGELLINEVNTLPGFTSISMYPKLIQQVGVNYTQLVGFLVERAKSFRSSPSKRHS